MENLRLLREEKGLTQMQVALEIEVTSAAIQQYEAGTNDPSVKVLIKLADLFQVSIDFLLGRTTINRPLDSIDEQIAFLILHMRNDTVKHAALAILKEVTQYF